jgi:hypothetical protein
MSTMFEEILARRRFDGQCETTFIASLLGEETQRWR